MSKPIHIAITRRVRPGCEVEFQQGLREFFQTSFAQDGVWGALMLTPPPNAPVRDYGILRTFASAAERDAFYASPQFRAWDEQASQWTEGEPEYRELHGLEAWFRAPHAPPRWKMAIATFLGVFPVATCLSLTLGPAIKSWHFIFANAVFNACVVVLLTWVVMPLITRLLRTWLQPNDRKSQP